MHKIVIIGPESTGKSTLCQRLAEHYKTVWCPEFAREYLLQLGRGYSYDDLLKIAVGQLELEDALQTQAKGYYFIDTDMYMMKVWCEVAFNRCHRWILQQIALREYDLTFLCDVDLPWMAGPLRKYPEIGSRETQFKMYQDLLINSRTRWAAISGNPDQRLQTAVSLIDAFFYAAIQRRVTAAP